MSAALIFAGIAIGVIATLIGVAIWFVWACTAGQEVDDYVPPPEDRGDICAYCGEWEYPRGRKPPLPWRGDAERIMPHWCKGIQKEIWGDKPPGKNDR